MYSLWGSGAVDNQPFQAIVSHLQNEYKDTFIHKAGVHGSL